MIDTFTFANTPEGRALRAHTANIYNLAGREVREFEEDWTNGTQTTHVLGLEVGKRKDEGIIARDMKARKREQ
jgi:hypothetical protein